MKLDLGTKLTLKVNEYIAKPYVVHDDIFNNIFKVQIQNIYLHTLLLSYSGHHTLKEDLLTPQM